VGVNLLNRNTGAKVDHLLADYAKGQGLTINNREDGGFVLRDAAGTDYLVDDADEAFRVIAGCSNPQRPQAKRRAASMPVAEILPKRKRTGGIIVLGRTLTGILRRRRIA
jgi:hypothetical protein